MAKAQWFIRNKSIRQAYVKYYLCFCSLIPVPNLRPSKTCTAPPLGIIYCLLNGFYPMPKSSSQSEIINPQYCHINKINYPLTQPPLSSPPFNRWLLQMSNKKANLKIRQLETIWERLQKDKGSGDVRRCNYFREKKTKGRKTTT